MTRYAVTVICAALRVARRTAYYVARARPAGPYHRTTDPMVLEQIRAVTNSRATYGYRRVWAMLRASTMRAPDQSGQQLQDERACGTRGTTT